MILLLPVCLGTSITRVLGETLKEHNRFRSHLVPALWIYPSFVVAYYLPLYTTLFPGPVYDHFAEMKLEVLQWVPNLYLSKASYVLTYGFGFFSSLIVPCSLLGDALDEKYNWAIWALLGSSLLGYTAGLWFPDAALGIVPASHLDVVLWLRGLLR